MLNRPEARIRLASEHTDTQELTQFVLEMEQAFNRKDAERVCRDITRDAVWVDPAGVVLEGWYRIFEARKSLFDGPLRELRARYSIEYIRFPAPDAALVHLVQEPLDEHGQPLSGARACRSLYVMVRRDGRWWLSAVQNTELPTPQALRESA
ncbi:hypothetical protein S7S_04400 [Isoalcanivorax pacificus W11-5]|uniref:DUF4440 domain-containing protein n=1 Tax=Isoalcanivorax pacificus W11-5 TaxID=391936 RepID=A0A0B4XLQ7_9GAMM|nr:SgcJ/EcaC family oxidoreductase [Isoalcanivorax pacificus]AJD47302.1 hypothetical protein S7S_04400 [Isoalcanivorax pacificus W11-5]